MKKVKIISIQENIGGIKYSFFMFKI